MVTQSSWKITVLLLSSNKSLKIFLYLKCWCKIPISSQKKIYSQVYLIKIIYMAEWNPLSPKLQRSLNNVSKWQDLNAIINSLYFSGQPSNIINSNTKRVMPNQPSHKNRLSESLKYFTLEAHPAAGQQTGSSRVWILPNYPTNCGS